MTNDTTDVVQRFGPLFQPKTVAVVGASATSMTAGNVFIRRMRAFGYTGAMYPIHPSADAIDGLPVYRSLAETPQPIDYAYIVVSAAQVPKILESARGRVRYAQVISSGFGEVDEGKALQEELLAAARSAGCRLLGPNCLGAYSPRGRLTFVEDASAEVGGVGVISQSGGIGTDIVRRGQVRGLKFSGAITVGNCADLEATDLLEFYLADPQTRVVGIYLEAVKDGRRLFDLLKANRAAKPVVLLKGGRTRQGSAAAASHTGSLAGDDRVWVALSRQTGCVLAETAGPIPGCLADLSEPHPAQRSSDPGDRAVRQWRRCERAGDGSVRPPRPRHHAHSGQRRCRHCRRSGCRRARRSPIRSTRPWARCSRTRGASSRRFSTAFIRPARPRRW